MGLFKTTHKVSDEEKAFQAENLKRLENEFDVTKAWGVKKVPEATQFIYDEGRKCFVVVPGPEETFKLKNPYIVDFHQVEDVFVEVEEYWTEDDNKFAVKPLIPPNLLMGDYDKVFWRYNIYLNIVTSHPYAQMIRYQMNSSVIITRISGLRLMAKRGLELNGKFKGAEIKAEAERIAAFAEDQKKAVGKEKIVKIATHNRPEGIIGKMKEDYFEEKYVQRMINISNHLERAYRISRLLGK